MERCTILNMNPVLVARNFQYRVEVFFKEIVLDGPLGKVKYHVVRVEFQVRGSPHIHVFLWIVDAPVLSKENKEEYINFVDSVIRADLPDPAVEPELFKTVKMFQIHSHSKTCRKYKNSSCRFNFGHFFTDRTIVAEPLHEDMPSSQKDHILSKRKEILNNVKEYINQNLFPKQRNIIDPLSDNYEAPKSIPDILGSLDILESEYYNALSISPDSDFQVHLRRPPNSCFVNNYFSEGILAWQANIDLQPVFNHYKAITYMCKYLSKSEDECSRAMKQALLESRENDQNCKCIF